MFSNKVQVESIFKILTSLIAIAYGQRFNFWHKTQKPNQVCVYFFLVIFSNVKPVKAWAIILKFQI